MKNNVFLFVGLFLVLFGLAVFSAGAAMLKGGKDIAPGVIFAVIGGGTLAGGAFLAVKGVKRILLHRRLRREGATTEGTVVDVALSDVSINKVRQLIVRYSYRDNRGKTHEGESGYLSPQEAAEWKTGDRGKVLYDKEQPDQHVWVGRPVRAGR